MNAQFDDIIETFKKIREQIKINVKFNEQDWKQLFTDLKIAHTKLGELGWYLNGGLTPAEIRHLVSLSNEEINKFLESFHKGELLNTRNKLIFHFPKRRKIIEDAFFAYNKGLYNLCVPVFLTQADGITKDLLHTSLYKSRKNIPITKQKRAELIKETIDEEKITDLVFLIPLDNLNSISLTTELAKEKRAQNSLFGPLNRHGILHGDDVTYGTEINSLRCVSILLYLIDLKQRFFRTSDGT